MAELWDIYDENKNKTGKIGERDVYQFEENEYHIAVDAVIMNSKNEILISKRAAHKKFPGTWEINGGSILQGETSLDGVLREVKEELGLEFEKHEAIFLKEAGKFKEEHTIKDLWLFRKDVPIENVTFPDGEATEAKWVTMDEFMEMFENGEIISANDFWRSEYELALEKSEREAYKYIQKEVEVEIDRKLGSAHPKHGFIYPINYGYLPNTTSGDGEEIDCYVLGVDVPIDKFVGKCVAVIHRTNDDDDKLIVVPKEQNVEWSDDYIREITNFQEQYFESEIMR